MLEFFSWMFVSAGRVFYFSVMYLVTLYALYMIVSVFGPLDHLQTIHQVEGIHLPEEEE